MRFLSALALILTMATATYAQLNPVQWTFTLEKADDHTYHFQATATMDAGWAIYSQNSDPNGPIPTVFEFAEIADAEFIGEVRELSPVLKNYSDLFEVEVVKFKKEARFVQKIKFKGEPSHIAGNVTFMACDSGRCLPPKTIDFSAGL